MQRPIPQETSTPVDRMATTPPGKLKISNYLPLKISANLQYINPIEHQRKILSNDFIIFLTHKMHTRRREG
jgi:hypothetical protein